MEAARELERETERTPYERVLVRGPLTRARQCGRGSGSYSPTSRAPSTSVQAADESEPLAGDGDGEETPGQPTTAAGTSGPRSQRQVQSEAYLRALLPVGPQSRASLAKANALPDVVGGLSPSTKQMIDLAIGSSE